MKRLSSVNYDDMTDAIEYARAARVQRRTELDLAVLMVMAELAKTSGKPVFAKRVYRAFTPEAQAQFRPVEIRASLNRLRDRGHVKFALGVWSITEAGSAILKEDADA